jgi:hypothetical protein
MTSTIAHFVNQSLFSYSPKPHSYALKIKSSFINYFQRIFILTFDKYQQEIIPLTLGIFSALVALS